MKLGFLGLIGCILPISLQGQVLEPPSNPPKAVAYASLREADVMWAKRVWRIMDLRQKMNQPYYYPMEPNNERVNLITVLRQGVGTGAIQAYDPNAGDDFRQEMDSCTALAIGTKSDTLMLAEAEPPYALKPTLIQTPFDPATVTKFKIKEDWYFDRNLSTMKVRILAICPIMEVYDAETGELKGEMEMFWVNYDEARNYLSQYQLYNMFNNAQRLSYDDAFQIRLFSSTIVKEDNIWDRYIASYTEGEEGLLEAEEIKKQLMLYESDLWEY